MKKQALKIFDLCSIVALFLAVVIAASCMFVPNQASAAWDGTTANFASGSGTSSSPYVINNEKQMGKFLLEMSNSVTYAGKYFVLGKDLDMTGGTWDLSGVTFAGHFDGRGYTITAQCPFLGIIGEGATVQGLNYICTKDTGRYVFCLTNWGTIRNCVVKGDAGINSERAYSSASILAENNRGTITGCGAIGSVDADGNDCNAEAGMVANNYGTISNCYAAVSAYAYASGKYNYEYYGPIVGDDNTNGKITDCVYDKEVYTKSVSNAYGLTTAQMKSQMAIGYLGSSTTPYSGWVINNAFGGYPHLQHLAHNGVAYVTGYKDMPEVIYDGVSRSIKLSQEGTSGVIYYTLNPDITDPNQFTQYTANSYISISGKTVITMAVKYNSQFGAVTRQEFYGLPGSGTTADPYEISRNYQLPLVEMLPNAQFKLVNDLTFTEADYAIGGTCPGGWDPIDTFAGIFDGQGYAIYGLEGNKGGLFKYNTGTIKNVRIVDHRLTGSYYMGAVVDQNSGGLVSRCYTKSAFTLDDLPVMESGSAPTVGGVVGYSYGTVEYCRNDGLVAVTGTAGSCHVLIGGIVGQGDETRNCINTGDLIYKCSSPIADYVLMGGIAGSGYVYNCKAVQNIYFNGSADYNVYACGLVGDYRSSTRAFYSVADFNFEQLGGSVGASIRKCAYTPNGGSLCYDASVSQLPSDCPDLTFGYGGEWWVASGGVQPQGTIGPDGHAWVLKSGGQILPTCTAEGDAVMECVICGKGSGSVSELKTISPVGHRYTNYISNDNATCTADGTKTATCDRGCGSKHTVTEEGTKKEHGFTVPSETVCTPPSCDKVGTWYAMCPYCKEVSDTITLPMSDKPVINHSYGEDRICTGCGKDQQAVTITSFDGKQTEYDTLEDAVKAAVDKDIITLNQKVYLSKAVTFSSGNITLDLNKNMIDVAEGYLYDVPIIIVKGATLTIEGNSTIWDDTSGDHNFVINDSSCNISVQSGKLIVNQVHVYSVCKEYAVVVSKGATVEVIDSDVDHIRNYGNLTVKNSNVPKITGSAGSVTYIESGKCGIFNSGTLYVNGGEIDELSNYDNGHTEITGGTVKKITNYGHMVIKDDAVITGKMSVTANSTTAISGGIFTGGISLDANIKTVGDLLAEGYVYYDGTFAYGPNHPLAKTQQLNGNPDITVVPAEGRIVASRTDANGNVTTYVSVEEALDVSNDEGTVKLLGNTTLSTNINVGSTEILDLDGWTLTVPEGFNLGVYGILMPNGGTIDGSYTVGGNSGAIGGTCDGNTWWKFREANGVLTIWGDGLVADFDSAEDVPWYDFRDSILVVVIEDGVTGIGDYAFCDCPELWHVLYQGTETQWDEITIGSYNDDFDSAILHCNVEGNEIVESNKVTCTEKGLYECYICHDILTESIEGGQHDWKDATCKDPMTCDICGETEGEIVDHNPDNLVFTKNEKTIIGTCGVCEEEMGSLTLSTPDQNYDAEKTYTAIVTGEIQGLEYYEVTYCCPDGCTKPGSHTANLTIGNVCVESHFRINNINLTVVGVKAEDRVYNGTDDRVKITEVILEGVPEGADVAVDLSKVQGYLPVSTVGNQTKVTLLNIVLTGADAESYKIAERFDNVAIIDGVNITPKKLVLKANDQEVAIGSEIYDNDLGGFTVVEGGVAGSDAVNFICITGDTSTVTDCGVVNISDAQIVDQNIEDVTYCYEITYLPGVLTVYCSEHDWQEATCSKPMTCKICGETTGSVSDHKKSFTVDGSTILASCGECGTDLGSLTLITPNRNADSQNPYTAQVEGEIPGVDYTVTYYCGDGCTMAGPHTAILTVGGYQAYSYFHLDAVKLSVIGVKAEDRVYDANDDCAKITEVILEGVLEGSDVSVDLSKVHAYLYGYTVGVQDKLDLRDIQLIGEDATNYIIDPHYYAVPIIDGMTISPRTLTLKANDLNVPLGSDLEDNALDSFTVVEEGILGRDEVMSIQITGDTSKVTDCGVVNISNAQICNSGMYDVTFCYDITYLPGNLTVYCPEHELQDATCKAPAGCETCGETEGEIDPWGHVFVNGKCQYCSIIGGRCGNEVYWVLENGKLTVYGSGEMDDYQLRMEPWKAYVSQITSVEVLDGVTGVGSYAFYGYANLTDVTLADSVKMVGYYSFADCFNLTGLDLGEGLECFGYHAFYSCTALKELTLPGNLSASGESAFKGCSALEKVTFEEGAVEVGMYMFQDCTSLTTVNLPDSITYLGSDAFSNCTSLKSISIPVGVQTVGGSAFENCTALETVVLVEGLEVIGNRAFYGCEKLTGIVLPTTLTDIHGEAFGFCTGITELELPQGLTTIGSSAFDRCGLTSLTIPGTVKELNSYMFYGCENLTTVVLEDGVIRLYDGIFRKCINLHTLILPKSVVYVGDSVLENVQLTDLYYGGSQSDFAKFSSKLSAEHIHYSCTESAGHWVSCRVTGGCTEDSYTCDTCACGYTKNIQITQTAPGHKWQDATCKDPKTCSECGETEGTVDLTNHDYVGTVCSHCGQIGGQLGTQLSWIFDPVTGKLTVSGTGEMPGMYGKAVPWEKYTDHIVSLEVEEGVTAVGEVAFFLLTNLKKVVLAESVTYIYDHGFSSCYQLEELELPENLQYIGNYAFWSCPAYTDIVIPGKVAFIGDEAFWCEGNANIRFLGNAPQFGSYAFKNVTGTVIYPYDNPSWSKEVLQNYGGQITWLADCCVSGHDWQDADCDSPKTCDRCGTTEGDELGHYWMAATCIAPETCERCEATRGEKLDHIIVIDPAVAVTCTTDGVTEGKHCSRCSQVLVAQQIVTAKGHTEVKDEAVAATCITIGKTEGSHCSVCNKVIAAQQTIPAKGHTEVKDGAVEATCTADGLTEGKHCSVCKTVLVAQQTVTAKGHTEVTDKAVDVTCTENGLSEGKHCSVCKTVIVAQQTIPAKGHAEVIDKAVAATCTTIGKTEGSHCSTCGVVIAAQQTIPAKGHTEVTDKAVEATCTTAGKTEGSHCSACGVVIAAQQTIPAKGHTEVKDGAVEVTCTADGLTEGKHCSVCKTVLVAQQTVPAKGHTEVTDKAVDVTCTENGLSEGKHCSVCKTVIVAQQTIPAKGHAEVIDKAVAATCTTIGKTEGSHCSTCGVVIAAQQTIPAKGHTEVTDKAVEATCTTAGKTEGSHCSACGVVIAAQQTIPAKGHTEVTDEAVTVTCITAGKTEGKHCSVCNEVLVAQEEIKALGHVWEIENTANGIITYVCSACGEKKEEKDPNYQKVQFEDVQADAYYADAVQWAVEKGITNGYGSETTFCPDIDCTRGQVVTFLWRAAGSPEPASLNNPFTDVASNAYYYKAVLWAVEKGITAGYGSDTIFNPDGVCNRAQVATFMWRMCGKPSMSGVNNRFTDVANNAYYYEAVLWAVESGITNGYGSDTIFNPDGNCTRGQIVTFLYRGIK